MNGPLVPDDVAAAWDAAFKRNDKPGVMERLYASVAGLAGGYCARCDKTVLPIGVEYAYDHPERYDGISEWLCGECGRREGRWTGKVLTGGSSEPRYGEEREETIHAEQGRFPVGSQPR